MFPNDTWLYILIMCMQGVAWHLTALKSSSKVWNVKKAIIKCLAIFIPVRAWSIPRKFRKLLQNWEKVEIIFYDFCLGITAY